MRKKKIRVKWVDWEDCFKIDDYIEILVWILPSEYGITMEKIVWPVTEDWTVDTKVVIRRCRKNDIVILHFGKGLSLREAREVIRAIGRRGARTIVVSALCPSEFGADGGIAKPFEIEELVQLIRFIARKR